MCTKNSRRWIARTWLFGASWWVFIEAFLLYEIVHVSLSFFFDRRNWNSECPWQWIARIGIWLAGISTLTQSHLISIHYKSSERLQRTSEGLHANLATYIYLKSNISQKFVFLKRWYSHVSLLIHRVFTIESNVYHKLLILLEIGNES